MDRRRTTTAERTFFHCKASLTVRSLFAFSIPLSFLDYCIRAYVRKTVFTQSVTYLIDVFEEFILIFLVASQTLSTQFFTVTYTYGPVFCVSTTTTTTTTTTMHFFIDLPYVARTEVFQRIDRITRDTLRQCSNRTRQMIDSLYLSMSFVQIVAEPFSIGCWEILDGEKIAYDLKEYRRAWFWKPGWMVRNENAEQMEDAIKKFELILSNPNLRIKEMSVVLRNSEDKPAERETVHLVCTLMKMMFCSLNRLIHVQKFSINFESNQDEVLCFLPFLKPGYLKHVTFYNHDYEIVKFDKIVKLSQFQSAHYLILNEYPRFGMPIETFWNIPIVFLVAANITPCDINKLIQHYLSEDNFKKATIGGMFKNWMADSFLSSDNSNEKTCVIRGHKHSISVTHQSNRGRCVIQRL